MDSTSRNIYTIECQKKVINQQNISILKTRRSSRPWVERETLNVVFYIMNEDVIQERLDIVLISPEFRLEYDQAAVMHIQNDASNHVTDEFHDIFYFDKR